MAKSFNLTAQINLQGPNNLKPIVAQIKREISTVTADVKLKVDNRSAKTVDAISAKLKNMNSVLVQAQRNTDSLNASLRNLSNSLGTIKSAGQGTSTSIQKTASSMQSVAKNTKAATTQMEEFGKQSGLAIKRFAAFSIATAGIYSLINAINTGFKAFINFDRELIKLQQVTGKGATGIALLEKTITSLSTNLGVSSESLIAVASTLAQAGLSAEETRVALAALAKTELAPSFDNLTDTTEGAIAALRQFELQAGELEGALGSINAVAAAFAVESRDIITAIQRTGGVFASASKGVSEGTDALNEFIAIFTSVRQTTRESAETIATGLRTIFTRIQRAGTIDQLRDFGIELTDLEGKFVGPYEAIKRLSEGLRTLDPRDLRFSQIVEELGGFRQIGKVIPLIQQFAVAQEALKIAQKGQGSLTEAQVIAQKSLANQIAKVREQFLALIRDIGKSNTFQALFKIVTGLASGLISLAGAFKPILPILAAFGAIKGFSAISQYASGFLGSFRKGGGAQAAGQSMGASVTGSKEKEKTEATRRASDAIRSNTDAIKNLTSAVQSLENAVKSNKGSGSLFGGGRVYGFNKGGIVPGYGGGDRVPALLEGGEVVINKKAANNYGRNNLDRLNKYVDGGVIKLKLPNKPIGISDIDSTKLSNSAKGAIKGIMFERDFSNKYGISVGGDNTFPDVTDPDVVSKITKNEKAQGIELKYEDNPYTRRRYLDSLNKNNLTQEQVPLAVRKQNGGLIQKFMAGGLAEPMSIEEAAKKGRSEILNVLKKRPGGIDATAKEVGTTAAEIYSILGNKNPDTETKSLQEAILEEYVKTYNRQKGAAKAQTTKLENRGLVFGAAGMFGRAGSTNMDIQSDKLSRSAQVRVISGVMQKNIADQLDVLFSSATENLAQQAANIIGGTSTTGRTVSNPNAEAAIQGGLLEKAIQILGGPGAVQGQGFDFPNGLQGAASYFGLPDDIPTDLKRTLSGPSTIKDNIVTYLKNVMGYASGGAVSLYHGSNTGINNSILESFKKEGARSDIAKGYGQGAGFYVYTEKNRAVNQAKMRVGGGGGFVLAQGDKSGRPMVLTFNENLDPEKYDLDYELQKGLVVQWLVDNYEKVKEKIAPHVLGNIRYGGVTDVLKKDPTKGIMSDAIRVKTDQGSKKTIYAGDDTDIRQGELIGQIMNRLQSDDQDTVHAFEKELFKNPLGLVLKYVGSSPLKPTNIETFASGGSVRAMVSNGETYVSPKMAKKIGYNKLKQMNQADRNGMSSFAGGGMSVIKGPGSGTSDSIGPVNLPVGSFIIREKATKALGFRDGGEAFLDYKARQEGVSLSGYKFSLAQKLGRQAYETTDLYAGRSEEMKYGLAGKQDRFASIGATIRESKDPGAKQLAIARLDEEAEALAREMLDLNPTLGDSKEKMKALTDATQDIAKKLSEGDLVGAQDALVEALGKAPEGAEAMNIAMIQLSKQLGISQDILKDQFESGKGARLLKQQQFIASREGQRFGKLGEFAPEFTQKYLSGSKTLGGAADFIGGKSGKFSELFNKLGGLATIGSSIAVAAEKFEKAVTITDPNTAGVVGGVRGAGVGLGGGAILGSQIAGPVGALIGGISGAIIGGISGAFEAFNQKTLENNLKKLEQTSGDLDRAFKQLNNRSTKLQLDTAQQAAREDAKALEKLGEQAQFGVRGPAREWLEFFRAEPTGFINNVTGGNQEQEARQNLVAGIERQLNYYAKLGERNLARSSSDQVRSVMNQADQAAADAGGIETETGKKARNEVLAKSNQTYQMMRREGFSEQDAFTSMGISSFRQKGADVTKKSREELIEEGKKVAAAEADVAFQSKLLTDAMRDMSIQADHSIEKFRKAQAYLERFGNEIENIKNNANDAANALQGQASIRNVDRRSEQVLGNISAYSMDEVSAVANQTSAIAGGGKQGKELSSQIQAAKVIQDELPRILKGATDGNVGGVISELQKIFKDIGIEPPKALLDELAKNLEEKTSGRKNGTSLSDLADDDVGALSSATKIAEEAIKTAIAIQKQYNDAFQTVIDLTNQYAKALDEATQWQLKATDIRVRAEIELAEVLGKNMSLADQNQPQTQRILGLTTGVVKGGSTDAETIFKGMTDAIKQRESNQQELEKRKAASAADPQDAAKKAAVAKQLDEMAKQDNAINNARKALEELASDGSAAANALKGLQEQQKIAAGSVNFMQKVLTSDASELQEMNRGLAAYTKVISGQASAKDMNSLQFRKDAFAGLENISSMMPENLRNQMQARVTRTMLESTPEGKQLLATQTGGIYKGADGTMKPMTYGDALNMAETGRDPIQDEFINAYNTAVQNQVTAAEMLANASTEVATTFKDAQLQALDKINQQLPSILPKAKNETDSRPSKPTEDKDKVPQDAQLVASPETLQQIRDAMNPKDIPKLGLDPAVNTSFTKLIDALYALRNATLGVIAAYGASKVGGKVLDMIRGGRGGAGGGTGGGRGGAGVGSRQGRTPTTPGKSKPDPSLRRPTSTATGKPSPAQPVDTAPSQTPGKTPKTRGVTPRNKPAVSGGVGKTATAARTAKGASGLVKPTTGPAAGAAAASAGISIISNLLAYAQDPQGYADRMQQASDAGLESAQTRGWGGFGLDSLSGALEGFSDPIGKIVEAAVVLKDVAVDFSDAAARAKGATDLQGTLTDRRVSERKKAGKGTTIGSLNTIEQGLAITEANNRLAIKKAKEIKDSGGSLKDLDQFFDTSGFKTIDEFISSKEGALQTTSTEARKQAIDKQNANRSWTSKIFGSDYTEMSDPTMYNKAVQEELEFRESQLLDPLKAVEHMANESTKKNSIYTHDTHAEKILLEILSVLSGGKTSQTKSDQQVKDKQTVNSEGVIAAPPAPGTKESDLASKIQAEKMAQQAETKPLTATQPSKPNEEPAITPPSKKLEDMAPPADPKIEQGRLANIAKAKKKVQILSRQAILAPKGGKTASMLEQAQQELANLEGGGVQSKTTSMSAKDKAKADKIAKAKKKVKRLRRLSILAPKGGKTASMLEQAQKELESLENTNTTAQPPVATNVNPTTSAETTKTPAQTFPNFGLTNITQTPQRIQETSNTQDNRELNGLIFGGGREATSAFPGFGGGREATFGPGINAPIPPGQPRLAPAGADEARSTPRPAGYFSGFAGIFGERGRPPAPIPSNIPKPVENYKQTMAIETVGTAPKPTDNTSMLSANMLSIDPTSISALNTFNENFNKYVTRLENISFAPISGKVELEHNIKIDMTGAASITSLNESMQKLAVSLIQPQIDKLRGDVAKAMPNNPDFRATTNSQPTEKK